MVQATVISAFEVQKCIGTEDKPFKIFFFFLKKKFSHDKGEGTRLQFKP